MADPKPEQKGMPVVSKEYFPQTIEETNESQSVGDEQMGISVNDFNCLMGIANNTAQLMRSDAISQLLNPGLNINYECHYPDKISDTEYVEMFNREGLGERVVNLFPEESWLMNPEVKVDETSKDVEFDKQWKALEKEQKIYHYLQRVDILSGIGRYGVLLLGLDDGKDLLDPVDGINPDTGEKTKTPQRKLIFLKAFQEINVDIDSKETATDSPRFDQPKIYSLKVESTDGTETVSRKVHWTRIIHIADNRLTSEVFGKPRMKAIWNRLLDIRKVLSGSAEMFWKGAYQGLGFETQKEFVDATIDSAALKETMRKYGEGQQKFIHAQGLNIKNLAPNVADPTAHIKVQIDYIALALGVPIRIFLGSERGELASSQDNKAWNKRIGKRREDYVSSLVLRPFIDRLIIFGILPEVDDYIIVWPDLDAPSDKEKAEVAKIRTEAMAKYVQADVSLIMSPKDFFVKELGMDEKEADELEKSTLKLVDDTTGDDDGDDNNE